MKDDFTPMGVNLAGPGRVRAPWVQRRAPKRDPTAAFSRKALGAAFFSSLAASGANPVCGAVLFFGEKQGFAAHC